jgi:hypothetical protein
VKLLDELKAVNPKTPGEWPQSVKLFSLSLIFLLVMQKREEERKKAGEDPATDIKNKE